MKLFNQLRRPVFSFALVVGALNAQAQLFPSTVPVGPQSGYEARQRLEQQQYYGNTTRSVAPASPVSPAYPPVAPAPALSPAPALPSSSVNPYALQPIPPRSMNSGSSPSYGYQNTSQNMGRESSQSRLSMAEGEPWKAVQSLNEQAKLNPFDAVALNNLAVARAAQGEYQAALQLLERAAKLAPNRPDVVANLRNLRAWYDQGVPNYTARSVELDLPRVEGNVLPGIPPLWPQSAALVETKPEVVKPLAKTHKVVRSVQAKAPKVEETVAILPAKRSVYRAPVESSVRIQATTDPLEIGVRYR